MFSIILYNFINQLNSNLTSHAHPNATTSKSGFMTADMVTKLNGISTEANKITITRKTGNIECNGSTYIDLGDGYGDITKGFIIGFNAYQITNASLVTKCAIQSQRYLRFYHGDTGNVMLSYEYFILKIT